MRTLTSRAIATAAAVAIAFTTLSLQPAAAGSRHGDDAAAFAAVAAIFGTIAGIIAAQQYRDRPAYGHYPSYEPHPYYSYGQGNHRPVHRPWRHHHHH